MKLEDQVAELAQLGVALAPGVTIDDLLQSYDRSEYESEPFDAILFAMGNEVDREPWGRRVSKNAWDFDTEFIYGDDSYVTVVRNLVELAGAGARVKDIVASVDFETREGSIAFTLDGEPKRWEVEVEGDWADVNALAAVMDALCPKGKLFYSKDNGQAMVLFCLEPSAAKRINEVAPGALEPVTDA
jgi:hypothetical protein